MTRISVCLATIAVLASCNAATPPPGSGDPASQRAYEVLVGNATRYGSLPSPKAMVACIRPPTGDGRGYRALNIFGSYGSEYNDATMAPGILVNHAKSSCRKWRDEKNANCECLPVDVDGQNVLTLN